MAFAHGDCVETINGERGKVIHTSRLTVFVAFAREGRDDAIGAFLESHLRKIDPLGTGECESIPPSE